MLRTPAPLIGALGIDETHLSGDCFGNGEDIQSSKWASAAGCAVLLYGLGNRKIRKEYGYGAANIDNVQSAGDQQ